MSASDWAPAEVRRLEEELSAMTQRAEAAEAENAELMRKIGEQHNVLKYLMDRFDSETWQCENCGHAEDTETMDSAIYLREYLAFAASQPGDSNETR